MNLVNLYPLSAMPIAHVVPTVLCQKIPAGVAAKSSILRLY